MLPDVTLPASLAGLLWVLRPVFTAPSFGTFCGLVAGLAGQVRRRTVCGMLLGACLDPYRPDGLPTVDETGWVRCPPTSALLGPVEAVA